MVMVTRPSSPPPIPGLTERPSTIRSGRPLKKRIKISYRSDLYMLEQIRNVNNFQHMLRDALRNLETATPENIELFKKNVEMMKTHSDELIVVLQVSGKINRELAYSRRDLMNAVEKSADSKVINKFRKRVQWLENKLESLIIRHLPGQKDVDSLPQSPTMGSAARSSTNEFLKSASAMQDSDDAKLESTQPMQQDRTPSQPLPTPVLSKPYSLPKIGKDSRLSFREPLEDESITSNDDCNGGYLTDDVEEREEDDEDDEATVDDYSEHGQGSSSHQGKSRSHLSMTSSILTDVTDEGVRQPGRQIAAEASLQSEKSSDAQKTSDLTKTALKTPRLEENAQTDDEEADEDYWNSEHHRVEFSGLLPYINELDPNSLHQVGLAIPGNYVMRPASDRDPDLPWRDQSAEIKDIHRIALDQLAQQIYTMQDRIYQATTLSINPTGRRQNTNLISRDVTLHMPKAVPIKFSSREPTRQTLGVVTSRPLTQGDLGVSMIQDDEKKLSTPFTHLVYYSKPIPPPKPLPITRVNRSKRFPRPISAFVFPDPDGRPAPERLVNQGKLLVDTQLVIYKAPARKVIKQMKLLSDVHHSSKPAQSDDRKSQMSLKRASNLARVMNRFHNVVDNDDEKTSWPVPKPQSTGTPHSGVKWDRITNVVEKSLQSLHVEERRNAAKQLGNLQCGDSAVFYALKDRIVQDEDERVQYEAVKSLVTLGCLENEVIQVLVDYLIVGNKEVRLDMIRCLCGAKNIQYISKRMDVFPELVKVLAHLCQSEDPLDEVAFEAAITFGKICVKNQHAVEKMKRFLLNNRDTHKKATALRILVKQFNETEWALVDCVLEQFTTSPVWDYRREAAQLLQHLGTKYACPTTEKTEIVYKILEQRLWDDSVELVRLEAAKTMITLNMYARAADSAIRRLADPDEVIRAHAATSLGTLGIKQSKVTRHLVEMLELDPSDRVRRQIIQTFGALKITEKRVMRILREREKGEGLLAKEAKRVLSVLEGMSLA